jgi:hypothetical protein
VQRVPQPVALVVGRRERPHRTGHERLRAERLPVTRIQLFPDEIVDRKNARRIC